MSEKIMWKDIKLLAMDFDGVWTDGFVYTDQNGYETVRCSRKDSLGLDMIQKTGICAIVISKETNPVVQARCKKVKVDCFQAINTAEQKLDILKRFICEKGISQNEVAYMGDDINDLNCIQFAGIGITVADGHPKCKSMAQYITQAKGGEHAIREVCELILKTKTSS
jgi:YrbI family 3-deoxy-D-manno-octulosonate 8-phosphate phosphatase